MPIWFASHPRQFTAAGAKNATIVQGALIDGFAAKAPYDVIFINGAVEIVPDALLAQLAEGGRLVAVIKAGELGRATLYLSEHGRIGHRVGVRCGRASTSQDSAILLDLSSRATKLARH